MTKIRRVWALVALLGVLGGAGCASDADTAANGAPEIGSVGLEANLCARCNDGNPCTIDTCTNPATGACAFTPAPTDVTCDDKNACTTNDKCTGTGTCRGTLSSCNDDNICTNDSCNKATGCAYVNNTAVCNDNSKCTTSDRCNAGTCVGLAKSCDDANPCTNDSCNPATGVCVQTNNTAPCADDGNLCTNDICAAGVCTHPNNTAPCTSDGNVCTDDVCAGGVCAHPSNTAICSDGNACTMSDHCLGGTCVGTPLVCNDGNPCTNDSCNPGGGCVFTPNSLPCTSDSNVCTDDVCISGVCAHPPNSAPCASDGNLCTADLCSSGVCAHPPISAACNDNNACTVSDQCNAGACGGAALDCNDNDPCTNDACDTVNGCGHTDNGVCATTAMTWPGANNVVTVDATNAFPSNLSGLSYEPAAGSDPAVLWAVRNSPSTLHRLVWNGSIWTPQTTNNWSAGKTLRYPAGTGSPDAEGVTRAEYSSAAIYVVTERNNDVSGTSRMSVLRFDTSTAGTSLNATHEWNLTSNLPAAGSNVGLEAITWIPDSLLVAKSFYDEAASHIYNPTEYPNHGTGLFVVGVEATGTLYAYALNHASSTFQRIATIASGHIGVMGLELDRDVGVLWAACDDTCDNESSVLDIDTTVGSPTFGRYKVRRKFARPSTLGDFNNEGIAIAPETECSGGMKPFFWSDDSNNGSHALRRDAIPCGSLF